MLFVKTKIIAEMYSDIWIKMNKNNGYVSLIELIRYNDKPIYLRKSIAWRMHWQDIQLMIFGHI